MRAGWRRSGCEKETSPCWPEWCAIHPRHIRRNETQVVRAEQASTADAGRQGQSTTPMDTRCSDDPSGRLGVAAPHDQPGVAGGRIGISAKKARPSGQGNLGDLVRPGPMTSVARRADQDRTKFAQGPRRRRRIFRPTTPWRNIRRLAEGGKEAANILEVRLWCKEA